MRRLDGCKARVTAHFGEGCNSSNGFEDGRTYEALGSAYGWRVFLPRTGWERFVSADGSGGAHLQFIRGGAFNYHSETCGHFTIEEL